MERRSGSGVTVSSEAVERSELHPSPQTGKNGQEQAQQTECNRGQSGQVDDICGTFHAEDNQRHGGQESQIQQTIGWSLV